MGRSEVYSSPLYFSQLDLRVGRVLEAVAHPNSETHYKEKVDIGNGETLEMVQEHQPYMSEEELVDRKVIVLCNLKVVKVARTKSQGMLLAVKKGNTLELIEPHDDAEIGERVYASGEDVVDPVTPIQMKKNKVWEGIYKNVKSTKKLELSYLNRYPIRSKAGPVHVESLKEAEVVK